MIQERKDYEMGMNQYTAGPCSLALIAGLMTCGGLAAPSIAQDALGDGRGLEANTRVGSRGRNYQKPSFEQEVQFRNAIATGNATGGVSFRGDLGYQAPGEFAGSLGSDALYSFRRDSLYSGLAGMGIRGTDALQYQFSMTTGTRVTGDLAGNLSVSRLGGASSASLRGGIGDAGTMSAIDPMSGLPSSSSSSSSMVSGTLRSTSSYTSTSVLTPELLTTFNVGIEQNPYGLVSSPLMGLVSTPMDSGRKNLKPGETENRLTPVKTSYDEVVKNLQDRAMEIRERSKPVTGNPQETPDDNAGTPSDIEQNNKWISERLSKLRRDVLGLPDPIEDTFGQEGDGQPDQESETGNRGVDQNGVEIRDPVNPYPEGEGIEGGAPEISFKQSAEDIEDLGSQYSIDRETLELIRGDGKRVTYLVDPTAETRNFYDVHMVAGERLLLKGRYFDAEERFAKAMSIRNGDVSAQLGRLHAQIGAGLVLSASLNLQSLMTNNLEVVSRRYSDSLLPSDDRLRELVMTLRERAGLEERESYVVPEPANVRVACGVLIAYLGYQLDDAEQMEDGFGVVEEFGSDKDRRLVVLLRTVWEAMLQDPQLESGNEIPDESKHELEHTP